MRHLMCFQRRNFCLPSGATQQHDAISHDTVLETQKVSKNKLLGLEPSKLMLQYPQYLAELGILLQAGIRPWLLGIVVHLVTNLVRTMFKIF